MDVDRVPASDPPSSSAGSGSPAAAGAFGAADPAVRLGVRRHPVVLAAMVSDLVVRAIEMAAAINGGRRGNLDRTLIHSLARDLGRDLGRAREHAQVRHIKLGVTFDSLVRALGQLAGDLRQVPADLGQTRERSLARTLIRCFDDALRLARELGEATDGILARHLDLRLSFSRDDDLELACELAACLDSDLVRALALSREPGKTRERALDLALRRSRALDEVCAQGVAGRLGISWTEGLADALLNGAMDDFTSADLTYASLADADPTGVRWSLSGTTWPPETDVNALLALSEEVGTGGVLVLKRRGTAWPPKR